MNRNTSKRNALKATTKKEQALAAQIAATTDEDLREELISRTSNMWVLELAEILEEEANGEAA